ncbi:hypothetical protein EB73_07285 [Mycobacterium sp. SWH-M3]|nr:hypothetical protein EB73_07285 [Mycobacterium sp. SWH-M3]
MVDGVNNPDEYLLNITKATGSLMLIRVYRSPDGTLKAHWATGEQNTTDTDPLEVVKLAHPTTGCKPGRRIDTTSGDADPLAAAWDAGYLAAQKHHQERDDDRRTVEHHDMPAESLIPDQPANPYRTTSEWDL